MVASQALQLFERLWSLGGGWGSLGVGERDDLAWGWLTGGGALGNYIAHILAEMGCHLKL